MTAQELRGGICREGDNPESQGILTQSHCYQESISGGCDLWQRHPARGLYFVYVSNVFSVLHLESLYFDEICRGQVHWAVRDGGEDLLLAAPSLGILTHNPPGWRILGFS
jgi:hypothetical protein